MQGTRGGASAARYANGSPLPPSWSGPTPFSRCAPDLHTGLLWLLYTAKIFTGVWCRHQTASRRRTLLLGVRPQEPMRQGSPPRMKIVKLFSGASLRRIGPPRCMHMTLVRGVSGRLQAGGPPHASGALLTAPEETRAGPNAWGGRQMRPSRCHTRLP